MKKFFLSTIAMMIIATSCAQDLSSIKLNEPNKDRGTSIMKALDNRRSTRAFSTKKLSLQDLSDLLWAAYGVNRPDGRRTAPTARNDQDIDLYAIMEEGAYLYDAISHELIPIVKGDYRALVADNYSSFEDAPVSLLIVSDISRFTGADVELQKQYGTFDAGIVSQNINLFASGCGFVTVTREDMNTKELIKVLKLSATQIPMLNNPVGYQKE